MTFIQVSEVPKRIKMKQKNSVTMINQFMKMRVKTAKAQFDTDEYRNPMSCYTSLHQGIVRNNYPIIIEMANGEVYLTRTDM